MEIKKYEFKDATVDGAIEKGLKELGLEREEVDVEVKSYGGIFSKATVEIIVKEEEATNEPLVSEEISVTSPVTEDELVEAENLAGEFVTALVAKMGINCAVEVNVLCAHEVQQRAGNQCADSGTGNAENKAHQNGGVDGFGNAAFVLGTEVARHDNDSARGKADKQIDNQVHE